MQFQAIYDVSQPLNISLYSYELPTSCSFQVYDQYPSVRYVLEQLNCTAPNWFNLYFVFETIKSDEQLKREYRNGISAICTWEGKTEKDRFLGTANWHRHSDYERSNLKRNKLPENPMTLGTAYKYIRSIVKAWLAFKNKNL
jgi:hypothetical protein